MTLRSSVELLYRDIPRHVLPHVGAFWENPAGDRLRVLAVGIAAWVDRSPTEFRPTAWAGWYRAPPEGDRFLKGVRQRLTGLVAGLRAGGSPFVADRHFDVVESVYVTNAVKTLFGPDEGAEATAWRAFKRDPKHLAAWHQELALMLARGVLPHLMVVFSERFWQHAWPLLQSDRDGPWRPALRAFRSAWPDPAARHRVNAAELEAGGAPHALLQVRLNHPRAQSNVGRLLSEPGFRLLAGMAAPSTGV